MLHFIGVTCRWTLPLSWRRGLHPRSALHVSSISWTKVHKMIWGYDVISVCLQIGYLSFDGLSTVYQFIPVTNPMKVTMFPRLHLQSAPAAMAALKAMGDCGVTRESSAQGTPVFSEESLFSLSNNPRAQEYWLLTIIDHDRLRRGENDHVIIM